MVWRGAQRASPRKRRTISNLLSRDIKIIPLGQEAARSAGELRAALETAGTPIVPYDVVITGQALRSGATLVTAIVSEFAHVRGFAWQDWTAEVR